MQGSQNGNICEFAGFRFDCERLRLWNGRDFVPLPPKASELLQLLLERPGEFVTKEEIFEKVWANTFVEDGVLTQNIYLLRKALGKTEDGGQIIENRSKLGYRVSVPVTRSTPEEEKNEQPVIPEAAPVDEARSPAETKLSQPKKPARRKWFYVAAAAALLTLALGSVLGFRSYKQQIASYFRTPINKVTFKKLTNTGDVSSSALSPDGKMLAFVKKQEVYLKDLATDRDIKLDIPGEPAFNSLQFSADGTYLYYSYARGTISQAKILRVSRFGGSSETVVEPSSGGFSLSPDNKFIAYYVSALPDLKMKLTVRNLESGEERQYAETGVGPNYCFDCAPAWSPDGKKLIHIEQSQATNATQQLSVIDVEKGTAEPLKLQTLRRFQQAAWMPDGESFVVSASDGSRLFHLWKVYYPTGDVQQITNGLSNFSKPAIAADGKSIIVQQTTDQPNIYIAEADGLTNLKQLTTGNSNDFGLLAMTWAGNDAILFSSRSEAEETDNLWLMNRDGGGKRQITKEIATSPMVPESDGEFVYFNSTRNRATNIFRIGTDGSGLIEVTKESAGVRRSAQISPDKKFLYFIFRENDIARIMRFNLANQTTEVVFSNPEVNPGFNLQLSPDGKYIAFPNWRPRNPEDDFKFTAEIAVVSLENTSDVKFIPISRVSPVFRFSPDSKAIEFISAPGDEFQLMRQGFDEAEPKAILKLPGEKIFNFDWSPNGKTLAISKGESIRDAVLLTDFGE